MAIKSKIAADDGLTRVERIDQDTDFSTATREDWAKWLPVGFEGMVRDAEQFWRAHAPPAGALPEPLTLAWYARNILDYIKRLREAIAANASIEGVVLDAIRLGKETEDAKWRFNRGDHVRRHVKIVTTNRVSARKPRPRGNSISDQEITATARRLRRTTLYAPTLEHSTRWLAGQVAQSLRIPLSTVRRRLTHLKIR
jgi:hypothetical protein